jgi:hypothetical protein
MAAKACTKILLDMTFPASGIKKLKKSKKFLKKGLIL